MNKKRETYLKMIYHTTPTILKKIADIERVYQKIEKGYNKVILPKKTKLGGLEVSYLEFGKFERKHLTIGVHWKPLPTISRQADPFCLITFLKYNTLCKLERILREMAE